MTPEQKQHELAAIRERHAKMPAGDYTKREQHDDWGLVRRPDGWPFADVCVSVDYGHEDVGKTAPDFVDAKREFVSHAVADIDFLLALLADAERERDTARLSRDSSDDQLVTLADWLREKFGVDNNKVIGERSGQYTLAGVVMQTIEQELAAANERAEQAADARQAEIVAWLRGQMESEAIVEAAVVAGSYADAIERGEWKGGGDAD